MSLCDVELSMQWLITSGYNEKTRYDPEVIEYDNLINNEKNSSELEIIMLSKELFRLKDLVLILK